MPVGVTPADVFLRDVLDDLGPDIARIMIAPQGLEVPVGEVIIYDSLDDFPLEKGAIVLAPGVLPDSAEARDVIGEATAACATGIAFKFRGRNCPWIGEAERGGIAVIEVADEMSWSQLNALLALAIPSRSAAMPGMAGVPLGDLFSLANAIAGIVGGAVTVEDPRNRVLAYSNLEGQPVDEARRQSILGRQVPDLPGVRKLYDRLWAADGVIREVTVEGLEILPRAAIAVSAGGQRLGSIWVVEGDTPFGPKEERSLEEAGRVAALHILHARASRDIERRMRGDLLRSFLEGRGDPQSTATRLGIPLDSPMVVVALQLATANPAEEELYRERLVDVVSMYSDAFRLKGVWVAIGTTVYGLMPSAAQVTRARLTGRVREIYDHANSALKVPLRAAISSTVDDLRHVPAACLEAERILRVMGGRQDVGVASIEDVRSAAALLVLRDLISEHPDLVGGPVQRIADHDAEQGTSYLETLRAYLSAFGDIPSAASSLGVHPNTFRYRLRRLIELYEIDLEDPDERLVLDLELRVTGLNDRT